MKIPIAVLAVCLAFSAVCRGEIEKLAIPSDHGLELHWWPKVSPPSGFSFDYEASLSNGVKMFVQTGSTYADAETVIYAKAMYKPRTPETRSLRDLMEQDKADVLEHHPKTKIQSQPALVDGDGKKLAVHSFIPAESGNWESVAYGEEGDGEEGDYYLLFTISSRSQKGFDAAYPAFRSMVASYRQKP